MLGSKAARFQREIGGFTREGGEIAGDEGLHRLGDAGKRWTVGRG